MLQTGWPPEGPTQNKAVPSFKNAQEYYKASTCWVAKEKAAGHMYYYITQEKHNDPKITPNFGLFDDNLEFWKDPKDPNFKFDFSCSAQSISETGPPDAT